MPRVKCFDEEEVLEKAMNLFWRQGYHATSIQNLVDHLGINRASLYDTYGGKEALFEKAFNRYIQQNALQFTGLMDSHASIRTGFQQLFLKAAGEAAREEGCRGCFVVNTTTELIPNEEAWASRLESNRVAFSGLFLKYLEKGVRQEEISPDKDLPALATYLYTAYSGLKVLAKTKPSEAELRRMVKVALSVLD